MYILEHEHFVVGWTNCQINDSNMVLRFLRDSLYVSSNYITWRQPYHCVQSRVHSEFSAVKFKLNLVIYKLKQKSCQKSDRFFVL